MPEPALGQEPVLGRVPGHAAEPVPALVFAKETEIVRGQARRTQPVQAKRRSLVEASALTRT